MAKKETDKTKKEKSAFIERCVLSALLTVAGLVLAIWPEFITSAAGTVVGWCVIVAGVVGLIVVFLSWPALSVPEILVCVLAVGLGVFIVSDPQSLARIVGLGLGAWLAIQGVVTLTEGIRLHRAGFRVTANLVIGAVMLVVGIVLLFFPLSVSYAMTRAAGIVLTVCGVLDLFARARAAKFLKAGKSDIVDADE